MRGRKKQVLRYALVPSAPRRAPQNRVVRSGRRVGVLPTAARLYFPTLSDESSRQTAALLVATLSLPMLSRDITKEGIMKRILFLTLTAALFASCERPVGPATHEPPAFWLTAATRTTFSGDATVLRATVLGLAPIVV